MLQYIFNNNEALINLTKGHFPSISQVKRTVLLELRKNNVKAPDHLYRLQMEENESYFKSFVDLFTKGITNLSNGFLEDKNGDFFVKKDAFFSWQESITMIPPSVLIAAFISTKCKNDTLDVWQNIVLPNTKHTMLLSPHIIQLENSLKEWGGLNELHIHLNGSLEVDKVWQDYLQYPHKIKEKLEKVQKDKPLEQFSQEGFLLTPQSIFDYLCIAKRLREYFFDYLSKRNDDNCCSLLKEEGFKNKQHLLSFILETSQDNWSRLNSPFDSFFDKVIIKPEQYPSLECFMFVQIFNELKTNKNEVLAELFYCYLLIYGLVNRLLSHQLHQNGFEQFQKITLNELREFSEEKFERRFKQFAGNNLNFIKFFEGRISPKKTIDKWIQTLESINRSWLRFKELSVTNSDMKLIIHFIKTNDDYKNDSIRYYNLRKNLFFQGHTIRGLLNLNPKYRNILTGIDAASSEFDAPPEVFGPVFRMMRNSGFKHFTYHAGEDFYHILSGIRAIYEAILFCNLTHGDRIGHAVALGLNPVQWRNVVGGEINMKQGEHLDDLVFLFYIIKEYKIDKFYPVLNLIKSKAEHLYFNIYELYLPIETLINGWKLRGHCPIHFGFNGDNVDDLVTKLDPEELLCSSKSKKICTSEKKVFESYHNIKFREKYNSKILVQLDEFILLEDLVIIQKAILEMMNRSEIVIETLPMSNVRIGFHQDFSTYHLWNWIKWKKEGVGVPPIIVGSDDTGIFTTNIYNEYSNIYLMLIKYHNLSHSDAMGILNEFRLNGELYKFDT